MGGAVLALSLCGCLTLMTSKYDAMGNQALIKIVQNANHKEAKNAAKTLGTRILNQNEQSQIMALFKNHRGEDIDIALVQSLVKTDARFLKNEIRQSLLSEKNANIAVELTKAYITFSEDTEILALMTKLLIENDHALLRYRAAKYLGNNYPEKAIDSFANVLKKEKSASVSELLCRILGGYGTKKQLSVVEDIANSTSRTFSADKCGGILKPMDSNKVRISAVKAVESIKSRL